MERARHCAETQWQEVAWSGRAGEGSRCGWSRRNRQSGEVRMAVSGVPGGAEPWRFIFVLEATGSPHKTLNRGDDHVCSDQSSCFMENKLEGLDGWKEELDMQRGLLCSPRGELQVSRKEASFCGFVLCLGVGAPCVFMGDHRIYPLQPRFPPA